MEYTKSNHKNMIGKYFIDCDSTIFRVDKIEPDQMNRMELTSITIISPGRWRPTGKHITTNIKWIFPLRRISKLQALLYEEE